MVLEAFSVSHGKASAFLPVIDLLRSYFKISSEDDERKRREKVNGRGTHARSLAGGRASVLVWAAWDLTDERQPDCRDQGADSQSIAHSMRSSASCCAKA